jgi:hypothetical protein
MVAETTKNPLDVQTGEGKMPLLERKLSSKKELVTITS